MATVARPLMQWIRWHRHCCFTPPLRRLFHSPAHPSAVETRSLRRLSFTTTAAAAAPPPPSSRRKLHVRSRILRPSNPRGPYEVVERESDSDSDGKKSRNEKKREARRAVRWGMELAAFSPSQIKLIIRVASLEQEVFDALMLVKRFGRDVREGKRRQFNYIGKLLRDAEPELMESLIQATKDSDTSKLQALSGSVMHEIDDDGEGDETGDEEEEEEEDEGTQNYVGMANRWFDALIAQDINITKEIYSIQSVEFDRQELRKLVREVLYVQDRQDISEENVGEIEQALLSARRALTNFLQYIAKRLPAE